SLRATPMTGMLTATSVVRTITTTARPGSTRKAVATILTSARSQSGSRRGRGSGIGPRPHQVLVSLEEAGRLQVVHLPVVARQRHQLIVGALLGDAPLRDHADPVGVPHAAETV